MHTQLSLPLTIHHGIATFRPAGPSENPTGGEPEGAPPPNPAPAPTPAPTPQPEPVPAALAAPEPAPEPEPKPEPRVTKAGRVLPARAMAKWDEAAERQLLELYASGMSKKDIAAKMERTPGAISSRFRRLVERATVSQ